MVVATAIGAAVSRRRTQSDPWVLADLPVAVVASILTWRTGGLEAAIVMHTVNNIGVFVVTVTIGGWAEAFVGENEGHATGLRGLGAAARDRPGADLVEAGRVGLDPWFRPSPPPLPSTALAGARIS